MDLRVSAFPETCQTLHCCLKLPTLHGNIEHKTRLQAEAKDVTVCHWRIAHHGPGLYGGCAASANKPGRHLWPTLILAHPRSA